jgi:DNA-binding NarL/FixJ family response regulator
MSWNTLDPAAKHHAQTHLTQRQLDILTLHLAGCGTRRISTMLGIHRTTVKDHLRTALTTMAQHDQEHT